MHVPWPSPSSLPMILSASLLKMAPFLTKFLRATLLTGVCQGSHLHWGQKLQFQCKSSFLQLYHLDCKGEKTSVELWQCWTWMDALICDSLERRQLPAPHAAALLAHPCACRGWGHRGWGTVALYGHRGKRWLLRQTSVLNAVQELCEAMRRLLRSVGQVRACKASKYWLLF